MNKKAKFFCESCGAEVPHNSKVCVNCGKFFASVRCPNCGKTGSSSTFINGCPDCGYAVGDSKNNYNFNNINKRKNNKRNSKSFSIFQNKKKGSSHQNYQNNNDGLPFWIYLIVTSILIVLIICFYRCMI